MTFQQCRYLVEIARQGSISQAAQALYVTQPSISKAMRELEREMEITILDRSNRGVLLTREGQELLFYARMLVEQSEAAVTHFKKQADGPVAKLALSSQHYGFVVQAVGRLMERLAGAPYELTLYEGKTTDVIDQVAGGISAAGVLCISNQNKAYFERVFRERGLAFTPLGTVRQYVFLRREHPLAGCGAIALEQLKGYPYLTYQQDDMPLYFAEEPINVNALAQIVYLRDRGAMNDLLAHTDGYNLGTGCLIPGYMPSNIISIPLQEGSTLEIGYIRRREAAPQREEAAFMELLEACLKAALPRRE